MPAPSHEVWQITVHQHTFSLERDGSGNNRLVQSYQSTEGTYSVQWWCSLQGGYVEDGAATACQKLREEWFKPTDGQIVLLSELIQQLYQASPQDRAGVWEKMPFHPKDGRTMLGGWESSGRKIMKDESVAKSELAFAAEKLDLGNAGFPALIIALHKFLG